MLPRSSVLPSRRRRGAGWVTWLGFAIVALGWAVLILDLLISEGALKAGNLVSVLSLRSDILTIAQTAIASGFALVLFGALRSGFGALTMFFDAVLQRASVPRATPEPVVTPREPQPIATPREPPPMPARRPPPPREPAFPDKPRERNYVVRSDGSVEVETMFGTRLFATLDEARDFIR